MFHGRQILLFCCWALLLTACKSTYSAKNVTATPPPLLRGNSRIYVAIPFDATFKKNVAQGSGKRTADTLYAAFSKYSKYTSLGKYPESASEALESAREKNADYLVYPNIVKWEDRATEWSGLRDKLQLKIDLIDLQDSKVAFSREIEGTGKWMTDGGDTPADLLEQPIEEYVNALFRRIEKPSSF